MLILAPLAHTWHPSECQGTTCPRVAVRLKREVVLRHCECRLLAIAYVAVTLLPTARNDMASVTYTSGLNLLTVFVPAAGPQRSSNVDQLVVTSLSLQSNISSQKHTLRCNSG